MPIDFTKNPLWLLQRSIYLDIRVFFLDRWTLSQKIDFLLKKYLILIRHKFKPFSLGKDSIKLFGRDVFYGTKYGLSDYQSMLTRLERLLDLAEVKDPQVVLDIGANVGFYSRLILEKYKEVELYSFEPVPQVFDCMQKNLACYANRDVKLFNLAFGAGKELRKMKFDPGNTLISSLGNSGNIEVDVTTLDEFCKENAINKIDILKIDVEGFEHEVLQGAQSVLKNVRYLMLEITLENNPNYTISKVFSLLHSTDFDFQLVAFRNYADTAEGKITLMDTILVNTKFS